MAITNIKVSNFKSFKDLDLNLGRFNVVIGANASGKSNFVEIFRFLRSIEENGLDNAVSLHGGSASILNARIGSAEPLRMRATSDRRVRWGDASSHVWIDETTYDFGLRFARAQGILIEDDHFTQKYQLGNDAEDAETRLDIVVSEGKPKVDIYPQDIQARIKKCLLKDPSSSKFYQHLVNSRGLMEMRRVATLLINTYLLGFLMEQWEGLFKRIAIFDIDPREIKKPQGTAGIPQLQENGGNLALVLKRILADPEKSRMFHNLLRDILPFAVEIGTEQYLGNSVLLRLREKYYKDSLLANLLSDGTVDAAALLTALYFEDKDVVIIEEPERNIHPHLISRLVEMMKDASRQKKDASREKQVIVTTHSTEVVKYAGLENLLLLTRDKEGFSTISRPAEKEDVKIFLENDLGLDEVFAQELWGMR
jgi:predicted ATPase